MALQKYEFFQSDGELSLIPTNDPPDDGIETLYKAADVDALLKEIAHLTNTAFSLSGNAKLLGILRKIKQHSEGV